MKGIKTLNLKFTDLNFEAVQKGKKDGEAWEDYIMRIAKAGAK